jgi:hypothetical protein
VPVLLLFAVVLTGLAVPFLSLWLTLRPSAISSDGSLPAPRVVPVRPLGPDDDPDFIEQLRRRIDRGDLRL